MYKTLIWLIMAFLLLACENEEAIPSLSNNIQGILLAPDGQTPIAGATVYTNQNIVVTQGVLPAAQTGCVEPQEAYTFFTCTSADGRYTVPQPVNASNITLSFRKGFFRQQIELDLTTPMDEVITRLPADPGLGAGRFAVLQGAYDRMEDILAKLGMGSVDNISHRLIPGTQMFDIYSDDFIGDYPPVTDLFLDSDDDGTVDLFAYDVIFINCGQFTEETLIIDHGQTLKDYVQQGGVLFITDQAYDFVEQLFPGYLNFFGDDTLAAGLPETLHIAETGLGGIEVDATVLDGQLHDWLNLVDCNGNACLNTDGSVTIGGFLDAWAVLDGDHGMHAANTKYWVEGEVSIVDGNTGLTEGPFVKPLTVSLNIGQGRVYYTSYHTDELLSSPGFQPQERILQYLIFEL